MSPNNFRRNVRQAKKDVKRVITDNKRRTILFIILIIIIVFFVIGSLTLTIQSGCEGCP